MNRTFSAAAVLVALGAVGITACTESSSIGAIGAGGGGGAASSPTTSAGGNAPLRKADKIDIVLAIDNSSSMGDKQAVMALALTDLVQSFTNPPCFDTSGHIVAAPPPGGDCPTGSVRGYEAIDDIHIGVVTSSLGAHGGLGFCDDNFTGHQNDHGHLITRGGATGVVDTYQNQGFLAWDPKQHMTPPGDGDFTAFTSKVLDLVAGVGQDGCGFESQLEGWYRFLADPTPYETIDVDPASSVNYLPRGTDRSLLAQRANFLRPDSMLVVIMLSDEDDCSVIESSFFPALTDNRNELPRARSECAVDPNDPCCASCGAPTPSGCPAQPSCFKADGVTPKTYTLGATGDDAVDLRCWDTKRRFGLDFLYPTDRYVGALSSPHVQTRDGVEVDNPIFSYLRPEDQGKPLRDPGLVALVGLVGVPWQDVAEDAANPALGIRTPAGLNVADVDGKSRWSVMVGDPANNLAPGDPFMVQSIDPRSGTNPISGDAILPPTSTTLNGINGHEWETNGDDLQTACVFDLPSARDCSSPDNACDCLDATPGTNPLCDGTQQIRAKAYPGTRHVQVIQGLGEQGILSSICPSNLKQPTQADFGYRSALRALVERVSPRLGK